MGFWLGTLIFALLELLGFGIVQASGARHGNKLCVGSGQGPGVFGGWRDQKIGALTSATHDPSPRLKHTLVGTTVACCWMM